MAEHNNSPGHLHPRPFTFLHHSPKVSPRTDEDDLLHARRQHSHKSARLLELKRPTLDREPLAESAERIQTHISASSSSFVSHEAEVKPGRPFQYSEPRSFHASDTAVPATQVLYKQPFFAARNSQNSTMYRKTLQERLQQGDQTQHSRVTESSNLSTQLRSYQPPALTPEMTPSYVNKDIHIPVTVSDIEPSETQPSVSNFKKDDMEIKTMSRSASVISTFAGVDTKGMQGVVMEAMKSIQRYESENEMQKSEIDRLTTRVASLEKEKYELAAKVQVIKDTTLKKLAISSQSLQTLHSDLDSLKDHSRTVFASVSDARAIVTDVRDLKTTITGTLQAAESYLRREEDGLDMPGLAARMQLTLAELKLDNANKQQVLDMLRDHLTDALSELASSRTHAHELQESYAIERRTSQQTMAEVTAAKTHIGELACALKQQQRVSLDATTQAGDMETRLEESRAEVSRLGEVVKDYEGKTTAVTLLETRISELQTIVETQDKKLQRSESTFQENIQIRVISKEQEDRLTALECHLDSLKESNAKLRILLTERESEVKMRDDDLLKLAQVKDSNSRLETLLSERESRLALLEKENALQVCQSNELRTSLGILQSRLDANQQSVNRLDEDLASSRQATASALANEESERTQRLEITNKNAATERRLHILDQQLKESLAQADAFRQRAEEMTTRSQSLQERFEEQSITLRLTRDSNAELQDRLVVMASGYAKDLERNCGTLGTEVAVLQSQKTGLQEQLEQHKLSIEALRSEFTAKHTVLLKQSQDTQKDLEMKNSRLLTELAVVQEQRQSIHTQLAQNRSEAQEYRAEYTAKEAELLQRIEEARRDVDREVLRSKDTKHQSETVIAEAHQQNAELQSRLACLQTEFDSKLASCVAYQKELEGLKAQILQNTAESEQLKQVSERLKERTRSLTSRYEKGDLDIEERALIKKVMGATQGIHDQELVQIRNELHRRDVLINSLQEAKIALENSLAKHLRAEAKNSTTTVRPGPAVMDFVNWPSSQSELSVLDSIPPGQDRDEPTTAPDDPPAEKEIITSQLLNARPMDSSERPLGALNSGNTGNSSSCNFVTPSAGTNKAYFSILAPDPSDEIGEFDEEEMTGAKRKTSLAVQGATAGLSRSAKRSKPAAGSEMQVEGHNATVGTAKPPKTYMAKSKRKRR